MPKRDLMWFLEAKEVKPATRQAARKTYENLTARQLREATQNLDKAWKAKLAERMARHTAGEQVEVLGITHREAAADVVRAIRKARRQGGVREVLSVTRHGAKWARRFENLHPRYRAAVGYAAKQSEGLSERQRAANVLRTIRSVGKKVVDKPPSTPAILMEFIGAGSFEQKEARRRQQQ